MTPFQGLRSASARRDVIAGVTVAAIAIPESLGYATIVGLPIQTGLYCALLPAMLFALVGSSRQLVVGADSATAALVAAGATSVAVVGTPEFASAVGLLGLLIAAFLGFSVLARLDFLADLISQPVLAGFLSGVGVSLVIGNLPAMFGIEVHGTTWQKLVGLFAHHDQAVPASVLLALGTVALMLLVERRIPQLPAALVALASMGVIGFLIGAQRRGVAMVGEIPTGLPPLTLPSISGKDASMMAASAASIAIVILAQSAAVSRSFALKNKYEVNIGQDLAGLALANIGSAITGGFAINGSPPRTAAGDGARSASQLVNLVMAGAVALVLLFLTGLFKFVPVAVLDGIVFTIGILLIKIGALRQVFVASRIEFAVAILTLFAVAFLGVERGILLAIVVSLVDRLRRQYHPHSDVLVADGVVAARLAPRLVLHGQAPDDVLVYRFSAPLFFENATFFGEDVRRHLLTTTTPVRVLVVDCAAMADIDFTGAQTLAGLARELQGSGGALVLTELSDDALGMVHSTGLSGHIQIVPRIEDAVLAQIGTTS